MDALALALDLIKYNLAPLPIRAGTKLVACKWRDYQDRGPAAEDLPALFESPAPLTVGVLCGAPSDRLLVLDCDSESALAEMLRALGDPATWVVRTPRGGHIYLRTPYPVRSVLSPNNHSVDLLAQGQYVLAPGAVHPNGSCYDFIRQTPAILELSSLDAIPGVTLTRANGESSRVIDGGALNQHPSAR